MVGENQGRKKLQEERNDCVQRCKDVKWNGTEKGLLDLAVWESISVN